MSIIRDKKSEILSRWRERVTTEIPNSRDQSLLALNDSLPDYLDNLAEIIDGTSQTSEVNEAKEDLIGKVHGQHRANNSYAIDQMIHEYFILKEIILEEYKSANLLDVKTCEVIGNSFQKALQVSATQFSKSLLESQENFITTLSHDLRNPLMVIVMQSQMLMKKKEFSQSSVKKILEASGKIDAMIQELLDEIKTKRNIPVISGFQLFNFTNLVHKRVSQYDEIYPGRILIKAVQTEVQWNERAIERVIDNLINNALKFGDEAGPVTLTIKDDDKNVFFSIHNTGEPIPEKELLTLFDSFKRGKLQQKKSGWGIGLSYVKNVVEAHRGTVLVNSDETGTEFKFELPKDIPKSEISSVITAKTTEPNEHLSGTCEPDSENT